MILNIILIINTLLPGGFKKVKVDESGLVFTHPPAAILLYNDTTILVATGPVINLYNFKNGNQLNSFSFSEKPKDDSYLRIAQNAGFPSSRLLSQAVTRSFFPEPVSVNQLNMDDKRTVNFNLHCYYAFKKNQKDTIIFPLQILGHLELSSGKNEIFTPIFQVGEGDWISDTAFIPAMDQGFLFCKTFLYCSVYSKNVLLFKNSPKCIAKIKIDGRKLLFEKYLDIPVPENNIKNLPVQSSYNITENKELLISNGEKVYSFRNDSVTQYFSLENLNLKYSSARILKFQQTKGILMLHILEFENKRYMNYIYFYDSVKSKIIKKKPIGDVNDSVLLDFNPNYIVAFSKEKQGVYFYYSKLK